MKDILRPYRSFGVAGLVGAGMWLAMMPAAAIAQAHGIVQVYEEPSPLALHSSSQGYLGVDLADVDQEKAQALKLKEVRGAVITLIDHDAPAGQIGLKVNDVVVKLNGQPVEGAEQLRRMLREIPAGRNVSLEISRDGNIQTLNAQLADRRVMERDVWSKIGSGGDAFAQAPGMGILAGGGGDAPLPGGFHMPFFGSSLKVGALVEPLTSQMAEYLGVPSGLMVKQVARKSEAETAGLKAFDVILKVGSDQIATVADWDRSLRANQGKPVQVTVLRDKKQQTLTLQVDSKRHSMNEFDGNFFDDDCPLVVAEIDGDLAQSVAADALKEQAEILRDSLANVEPKLDKKQMDELKQGMEEFRKEFKVEDFKLDEKKMDELKQQMEEVRKNFNVKDFELNQQQVVELKQQAEEIRKNFKVEDFKIDQKQMDELKRQMEELKKTLPEKLYKELDRLNTVDASGVAGRA
ncbi:MAG: PDZ domain-containing protein [Terracidiphilus sp.]